MTQEPEKLQLLTDDHGQPFKEQAVRYMKSRMGVDLVEELTGNCAVWEEQSQQSGSYEEQGSDISQELDSKLQEGESELPSENNPLETFLISKNQIFYRSLFQIRNSYHRNKYR